MVSENSLALLETLAVAGAQEALAQIVEPFDVVREVAEGDVPAIVAELREHNWAKANSVGEAHDVRVLRTGHHQLAQLLAAGTRDVEASYITGKSLATIRSLQNDPAFKELLQYYAEQQRSRDLNVYDRLTTIGAMASEVLAERLEESPEKFTNGELRALVELATPSKNGGDGGVGAPKALNVAINFLPAPATHDPRLERGKLVEGTFVEENKS